MVIDQKEGHLAKHHTILFYFFMLTDAYVCDRQCESPVCTQKLMTSTYACFLAYTSLFKCSSFCVSVCTCVCGLLWGANGFQLPSNTVEGAYSVYESVCMCACALQWNK